MIIKNRFVLNSFFSMLFIYLITIFSSTVALHLSAPFDIRIDHYKVGITHDLVINTPRPGFSWKVPILIQRNVQQIAYQIQIKSDDNQWDSGRILSKQSIHVSYKNLKSATYYQFRVRIWTTVSNQSSLWTDWIRFRTSVFDLHEYIIKNQDKVFWIGSTEIYMNELRKEFNIINESPIRAATCLISGLGYYELYLNGEKIDSSRKLDPGWTTYEKRTLFVSFDLTSNIKV
jgi:alpha-L-rhamnosidase